MHPNRPAARPFLARIAALPTHWRRRRRYARLHALDDRMLDDIGVTRAEVDRHAGLPLHRNAALELHAAAVERRRLQR